MEAAPAVSVVMPAYNREATLERAVASVLNQSFRDFELLLVDDGSTDRTPVIIEDLARADTRIRPLSGLHRGVSAARNVALRSARGSVFTYLDSDDEWMPIHLETVVGALAGRRRGLCYTGLLMKSYDDAGLLTKETTLLNEWDERRIYRGNRIGMNGLAHTRDLYEIAGGFDESMTRFVDWDFILKMVPHCTPRNLGVVTGIYHHHADPARVSRSAAYVPNRLRIAVRHRLGVRPKVRVYGGRSSDLERFAVLGLEAELRPKDEWLGGYQPTNDDVIVWHWSEWDEHGDRLERVAGKLAWESGLSYYVLPTGTRVSKALPVGIHRRFDFVVAANPADKATFREESARHGSFDLNPIDSVLVESGASEPSESMAETLREVSGFRRPRPGTCWVVRTDRDYLARAQQLSEQLISLGQDVRLLRVDEDAHDDGARHLIDFVPSRPVEGSSRRLHLGWVGAPRSEEALSRPHALFASEVGIADELRSEYPGLRIQELPRSPLAEARTLLAYAGHLLEQQHVDGFPNHQRPRICYFFGNASANSTRKRCHEIADTLRGHFEVRTVPFSACSSAEMVGADVVVFQRWIQHAPERVGAAFAAMTRLRSTGKVFGYDIDDYVFHLADGLPRIFMQAVDVVLVSTPKLRELAGQLNPNVELLPNGIDVDALDDVPGESSGADHLHVIAWSSDAVGLDRMRRVVEPVAARVPRVQFHFVGGSAEEPANDRIRRYGMIPIKRLFALVRGADVVLALADESPDLRRLEFERHGIAIEDFFDAKSEIKFQYAGLAGTPIVAEPRPIIFSEVIEDGVTGRIVRSDAEASEVLCELLLDPDRRRRLAKNARERVLAEHSLAARSPRYREVFWRLMDSRPRWGFDARDSRSVVEALSDPDLRPFLTRYVVGATAAARYYVPPPAKASPPRPDRWQTIAAGLRRELLQVVDSPRAGLRLPKRLWRRLRR